MMSASYPLLSGRFRRSCVTERVGHTSSLYTGVGREKGAARGVKVIKRDEGEEQRKKKKKDCTNGEGGGGCKLESGRSRHLCLTLLKTPPLVTSSFKREIMTVCETIMMGLQLQRATTKWSCGLSFSATVWIEAALHNLQTCPCYYCHRCRVLSGAEGEAKSELLTVMKDSTKTKNSSSCCCWRKSTFAFSFTAVFFKSF